MNKNENNVNYIYNYLLKLKYCLIKVKKSPIIYGLGGAHNAY